MHASREIRRWTNALRKRLGKRNGVVDGALFDNPEMERKAAKDQKRRVRRKELEDGNC